MLTARGIAATALIASAALLLVAEGLSWSRSARFGALSATTFPCSLRLDALSAADRANGLRERDMVLRGDRELNLAYTLRRGSSGLTFAAQVVFKVMLFGIALVLLWRGTDSASFILGAWCIAVGIALPDAWWGGLPVAARMWANCGPLTSSNVVVVNMQTSAAACSV